MIEYIKQNNLLSLFLIINIITAHVTISVLNDVIVPLISSIFIKTKNENNYINSINSINSINFINLMLKLIIWIVILLFCKYNNIKFQ
jgi:hypothetical protein